MSESTADSVTESTTESLRFDQIALSKPLLKSLEEIGYKTPSPIQEQSIPPLIEGHDILGQAQTGTGKTAAFSLPLLNNIDTESRHTQALVMCPTRELAIQVSEAIEKYGQFVKGLRVCTVYGGQSISIQLRQLKRGVHVIVGTPGRLIDHLNRGTVKLNNLQMIVLDEADEMLRMGFIEDVESILEHCPDEKQVALFSATMPSAVQRVANRYLTDPVHVKIKNKTSTVESVRQHYLIVNGRQKMSALIRILEVTEYDGVIVFTRTKAATVEVSENLEAKGYAAACINGDMSQPQRERTIERLKSGGLDIVVATDVAARGLDVPRITHVFNYDLPFDPETYVHRIGRTGRAGREGDAILFASSRDRRMIKNIERMTRQKIAEFKMPSVEEITAQRTVKYIEEVVKTIQSDDLTTFKDMVNSISKDYDVSMRVIAAAFAKMAQKDKPLVPELTPEFVSKGRSRDRDDRGGRDRGRGDRRGGRDRDRGDRRGSRDREDRRGGSERMEEGMKRYRINVGRDHGVQPGNIVGAVANEADISSSKIGHIKLYDEFSTLDLPEAMESQVFDKLRGVQVKGQYLDIRAFSDSGSGGGSGGGSYRKGPRNNGGGSKFKRARKRPSSDDSRGGDSRSGGESSERRPRRRM